MIKFTMASLTWLQKLPNRDQIYAKLVGAAIALNEKRIRQQLAKLQDLSTEEFFLQVSDQLIAVFQERKKILQVLFLELENLPLTKKTLFAENLIIQCLQEELLRRQKAIGRQFPEKQYAQQIPLAIAAYMCCLQENILQQDIVPADLATHLQKILQRHLLLE